MRLTCSGLAAAGALVVSSWGATAGAQHKYALQLFHFNVQYVCGGTIGYLVTPNEALDLDNDAIEDRIITESFEPIVDLFEKHPDWGVDLEMQAYMLDIIAWRHPALLDKMRALAKTGQIDINSFHYSDQLFVGYPEEDWKRSNDLTHDVFARHDVPLSRSVFCQEGQSAAAMAERMDEAGYQTMVWPKNLWSYQHGDDAAAPLYSFGDIFMVQGGKGASFDDGNGLTIDTTWTFLDDGELLATGDINPYFPELFFHDPASVTEYEQQLLALEADGYLITTVDKYVDAVKDLVTPSAPPPLLDGTWQPNSTGGVQRWMGGKGLFWQQERDNHVRTVGQQAHRELVAAETIASVAALDVRDELDAAWRMLFLGQVTDASGINPFRGEVYYGISHMAEAMRIARDVIVRGKDALGMASVTIDPAAATVTNDSEAPFTGEGSEAPVAIDVQPGDRALTESWERLSDGHWRVTLDFGPGEFNEIAVVFPGALEDTLAVGLALDDETPFILERSAFSFESFHFALPTGYIGLGEGRFVIKDTSQIHVVALVDRDDGSVTFVDQTVAPPDAIRWVFHVFEGTPEAAAQTAIAINSQRRIVR
jgi:hypothetical protein